MPYRGKYGDAAPVTNRLAALSNDVSGLRHMIEERFACLEKLVKVDLALRAGFLKREEVARLIARPDSQVVSEVVDRVLGDRLGGG